MRRVVITGMGIVAPNGTGLSAFEESIRQGRSGIQLASRLMNWELGCWVAGWPTLEEGVLSAYFSENTIKALKSTNVIYGCVAAIEAWLDAGLPISPDTVDWETGCMFGTTSSDTDVLHEIFDTVDRLESRRLGARYIEQTIFSGVSAYIGGLLGLGNQVSSNASACATGTESILLAYDRIRSGYADRMVAGSAESASPHIWAASDAMRILTRKSNQQPEAASRPMSATAAGFVPSSGAGALILEERETALARGARIYAEIRGGYTNSGGQRDGGTMTAPSPAGVRRCIERALTFSNTTPNEIDLICGHLTSTFADKVEVRSWATALNRWGTDFPYINSLKSMIGHTLGAAGSIESVAAILQLHHGFIHPSLNCEDLHPEVEAVIDPGCIPTQMIEKELTTIIKANFGFGDVNSCIVYTKP
jgi:3-oxoacyl-(acyl-carrier-protein) synthase